MFQLKATQEVDLEVTSVTDKKGNPTSVENSVWGVDDESVATITVEEGAKTTVVAGGLGLATVTLTADADLGSGVVPIEGTFEVEVVAGDASVVNITPGAPREQS